MEMGVLLVGPQISNPLYLINVNYLEPKSVRSITVNLVFADKIQKNLIVTIPNPLTETIAQKGETWLKMKSVTLIKPERGAYREII